MAIHSFDLEKGLSVGGVVNKHVVLRELTAGDLIDAMAESERVVMVPTKDGAEPRLVLSDSLMGINCLRRQVKTLGDMAGPLDIDVLRQLSAEDLNLLQKGVEDMEKAIYMELVAQGRAEPARTDDQ